MTPQQFDHLDVTMQEFIVLKHGSFLALRQEPEFIIKLYQLDSFYVELFFHQIKNRPLSIKSFSNTGKLDSYLNGIDLGFINC